MRLSCVINILKKKTYTLTIFTFYLRYHTYISFVDVALCHPVSQKYNSESSVQNTRQWILSPTQLKSTQIGLLSQVTTTCTTGKYGMKTTESNNEGQWSGSRSWPSTYEYIVYQIDGDNVNEHNGNATARTMKIENKHIRSGTATTRSSMIRYCIQHCSDCDRTLIRASTHNNSP